MMLRGVRVGSLDLDKTFRANGLIAAPCLVQMWWVVHETDGTLRGVLVQKSLDPLAIHVWVFGKV